MIKDHVISNKWATAINLFNATTEEEFDTLEVFRSWYLKANTIEDVPQPYRGWVENGLPKRYLKQTGLQKGTVTPKFSIEEDGD